MIDVVSHYRILDKLGAGGMGEVYLAEDTTLNRKVAIKFIRSGSASGDQANRRLLREARAAAMLDHPNICAIHEIGEEAGRHFIVMQYLEGETLDRLVNKRALDLNQILSVAVDVADALAEAHARGIVHRDIKPSNIMVTPRGQAKVTDFGLASVGGGAAPNVQTQSALSTQGAVAGTLPYMSPEQVRGEPLDTRSDIFGFGATIYEAVTGHRPFAADSPAATTSAILTQQPPPLARYAADVPQELQRIVGKCLEKERDERYQSAADLKLDLDRLRRGAVMPPASGRRRPWMMVGAVAAVAVLLLGALYLRQSTGSPSSSGVIGSIAVLPFANSSGDQNADYLSDGITESIINTFSRLPALRVMARTTVFRYKNKDVDPQAVGRDLEVDGVLTGKVLQQGDTLVVQADLVRVADGSQLWGDRFSRKMSDLLAIQDEIAKQIAERLRGRLSGDERQLIAKRYTDSTEAYELFLKGRFFYAKLTEEDTDKSIEYYLQAIAIDPNYALAYVGLADSYARLGGVFGFRSPRETLPRGQEFLTRALQLDPQLGEAYATLANYKLQYEWNWAQAEAAIKRALELNPNQGAVHQVYGSFYQMQGRLDEAIAERQLGQKLDPLSPFATANVGYPNYYAHRYDDAIAHYRRALELDPNYSWAHLWIGQALVQKGQLNEAIDAIRQAVHLSGGDVRTQATLGHALAVAGRRPEALRVLADLQALSRKKYVSPYFVALIHVGLKDDAQALASLDAAYDERHPYLVLLKVEPVFDRLRADRRFLDLERRVGLF